MPGTQVEGKRACAHLVVCRLLLNYPLQVPWTLFVTISRLQLIVFSVARIIPVVWLTVSTLERSSAQLQACVGTATLRTRKLALIMLTSYPPSNG